MQINQIESNQMQVIEESGKLEYPEEKKKSSEKTREPTEFKLNSDTLSYKETL